MSAWEVLSHRTVYDSDWVRVHQMDLSLPDGNVGRGWHLIDYPHQAAGIVPIGDDGRILMIRQYRFTIGHESWETPGGRFETDEAGPQAAHRELREETGYDAGKIEFIGKFFPSCGSSNQVFNIFVARELKHVSHATDANETIALQWFTPAEIRGMIRRNEIVEGMTLTALLWVLFFITCDGNGSQA